MEWGGRDCWAGAQKFPGGLIPASHLRKCPLFSSSQVGVPMQIDPHPHSDLLMKPHCTQVTSSSLRPGHWYFLKAFRYFPWRGRSESEHSFSQSAVHTSPSSGFLHKVWSPGEPAVASSAYRLEPKLCMAPRPFTTWVQPLPITESNEPPKVHYYEWLRLTECFMWPRHSSEALRVLPCSLFT